jgi:hypothetical protein
MKEKLEEILRQESVATQTGDKNVLTIIDREYRHAIDQTPKNIPLLVNYNRFRLNNLPWLPQDRHQVVLGGMNDRSFPSIHTYSLLRKADVVSITTKKSASIERVHYDHERDQFLDIITRFPEGFSPDFFLDLKVESAHIVPQGIEKSPFPTVCSFTHMIQVNNIGHLSKLFDVLIPLSRPFIPMLQSMADDHKIILDYPFGFSWGAFDDVISATPWDEKQIDVYLSFAGISNYGRGNIRDKVASKIKLFKEKYGDQYNILISEGLPKEEYLDNVKNSKIVLSTVPLWGPYTYRTSEVMSSGSLLFQAKSNNFDIPTDISDYFIDGEHLVSFEGENLEHLLLYYLKNQEKARQIAEEGHRFVVEKFSYNILYDKLFSDVKGAEIDFSRRLSSEKARFHLGLAYWQFDNDPVEMKEKFCALPMDRILNSPSMLKNNNLLVVLPRLFNWLSNENIYKLLVREEILLAKLKTKLSDAMSYLFQPYKDDLLVHWNYLAYLFSSGNAVTDDAEVFINHLNCCDDIVVFDPFEKIINFRLRPDYFQGDDYGTKNIFEVHFLKSFRNFSNLMRVYKEFMLWHCYRYLFAEKGNIQYAQKALDIYPELYFLHEKLGDYYRIMNPPKAIEYYKNALEMNPGLDHIQEKICQR